MATRTGGGRRRAGTYICRSSMSFPLGSAMTPDAMSFPLGSVQCQRASRSSAPRAFNVTQGEHAASWRQSSSESWSCVNPLGRVAV